MPRGPGFTSFDPDVNSRGLGWGRAGGTGRAEGLGGALEAGGGGIQGGRLVAYGEQAGIDPLIRKRVLDAVVAGEATLRTDPRA